MDAPKRQCRGLLFPLNRWNLVILNSIRNPMLLAMAIGAAALIAGCVSADAPSNTLPWDYNTSYQSGPPIPGASGGDYSHGH
jgi:hypothetical protein